MISSMSKSKRENSKHTAQTKRTSVLEMNLGHLHVFVTRRRNKFIPRRSHIGQYETPCRELTQCDLCAAGEPTVTRQQYESFPVVAHALYICDILQGDQPRRST
jgi:hypothetical protein